MSGHGCKRIHAFKASISYIFAVVLLAEQILSLCKYRIYDKIRQVEPCVSYLKIETYCISCKYQFVYVLRGFPTRNHTCCVSYHVESVNGGGSCNSRHQAFVGSIVAAFHGIGTIIFGHETIVG